MSKEAMKSALLKLKNEMLKRMYSKDEPKDLVNPKIEKETKVEISIEKDSKPEMESDDVFDRLLKESFDSDRLKKERINNLRPKSDITLGSTKIDLNKKTPKKKK